MALAHAGYRREDLARRAIAALECVVVDEGLLHRMQRSIAGCEALDRADGAALRRRREHEAGDHPPPIEQNRAGAALAVVAALLGAGQPEVLAQRIEQCGARIERHAMLTAVDRECESNGIARISYARRLRGGGVRRERPRE